jgi:transposase-like protein
LINKIVEFITVTNIKIGLSKMILIPVTCPDCKSDDITKYGKTKEEKQRCYCHNETCKIKTFILNYSYNGCLKNVKESIVDMSVKSV